MPRFLGATLQKHNPTDLVMTNVHPLRQADDHLTLGQMLKMRLVERGMDQTELAGELKVSRATVNNVVNDKYPISRSMAEKLSKVFETPIEYWFQDRFDETQRVEGRPHAGRLSASDIRSCIENERLVITGFDLERDAQLIQPSSIDLRAGALICKPNRETIDISDRPYLLNAGETVLMETHETIDMPPDLCGNFGGMAKLIRQFISYGLGIEIDPGFSGKLQFLITNQGVRRFRISAGMPIVTVVFQQLDRPAQTYTPPILGVAKKDQNIGDPIKDSLLKSIRSAFSDKKVDGTYLYDSNVLKMRFATDEILSDEDLLEQLLEEAHRLYSASKTQNLNLQDTHINMFLEGVEVRRGDANSTDLYNLAVIQNGLESTIEFVLQHFGLI